MLQDKNVCELLAAGGLSAARAQREVHRSSVSSLTGERPFLKDSNGSS